MGKGPNRRADAEVLRQRLHGKTTEEIFKKFFNSNQTIWNWINPDGTLTRIKDPSKTIMWCSHLNRNVND